MNKLTFSNTILFLSGITVLSASFISHAAFPMDRASVINGSGIEVCPQNTLCLYMDGNYNKYDKDRTKILVIPAGIDAENFSNYVFTTLVMV